MNNRRKQSRVGAGFQAEIPALLNDNEMKEERRLYNKKEENVDYCYLMYDLHHNNKDSDVIKPIHPNLLLLCENPIHPNFNYTKYVNNYRENYNKYKNLKIEDFEQIKHRSASVMSMQQANYHNNNSFFYENNNSNHFIEHLILPPINRNQKPPIMGMDTTMDLMAQQERLKENTAKN